VPASCTCQLLSQAAKTRTSCRPAILWNTTWWQRRKGVYAALWWTDSRGGRGVSMAVSACVAWVPCSSCASVNGLLHSSRIQAKANLVTLVVELLQYADLHHKRSTHWDSVGRVSFGREAALHAVREPFRIRKECAAWYAELNHTGLFRWARLSDMLSCTATASSRWNGFSREAIVRRKLSRLGMSPVWCVELPGPTV